MIPTCEESVRKRCWTRGAGTTANKLARNELKRGTEIKNNREGDAVSMSERLAGRGSILDGLGYDVR